MPKKIEPIIEEEEDLAKEDYEEDKSWEKAFDDTEDDDAGVEDGVEDESTAAGAIETHDEF
jgi:hypothetical protein